MVSRYRAETARYGTFIESWAYLAQYVTLRAFRPEAGQTGRYTEGRKAARGLAAKVPIGHSLIVSSPYADGWL
jgi:hypothetical protein